MTSASMWEYSQNQQDWNSNELTGYKVEATDGSIGKIDRRTTDVGAQCVVVDTSSLPLFGEKVMLPAGTIERIDHDDQRVFVRITKEQVKNAPDFDDAGAADATYREKLSGYYSGTPRS